jgi:hypothetical protein
VTFAPGGASDEAGATAATASVDAAAVAVEAAPAFSRSRRDIVRLLGHAIMC